MLNRRDERRRELEAEREEAERNEAIRRREHPTSQERMLDMLEQLRYGGSGTVTRGEFEGLIEIVRCLVAEEEYFG